MTSSDSDLFMSQMDGVTQLKHDKVTQTRSNISKDLSTFKQRQWQKSFEALTSQLTINDNIEFIQPDDLLSYKKDGVQSGVFKNLRLAKYDIEAQLDLTGVRLEIARKTLIQGLFDCHKKNTRVILIKHGKGEEGARKAVLKSHLNAWLPQFDFVLAYHSAQTHHGGYRACYVLLSKNGQAKLHNKELHTKK